MRRGLAVLCLGVAVLLLAAPPPPGLIERIYATGIYPPWARGIVPVTDALPFAAFDALLLVFVVAVIAAMARAFRRRPSSPRIARIGRALLAAAVAASVFYLWFLASWGLNYHRVPLKARLDYDPTRVTEVSAHELALKMVRELNRLHPMAWARPWPALHELPAQLAAPRDRAAAALRLPAGIRGGVPKRSLLQPYFRWAGIDGVTDPFLPEIIVNADVLPAERAFIVAHEWGHLAGLAHEAEAGFAGWRICLEADEQPQYSAWLSIYGPMMAALPAKARSPVAAALAEGPRRDLRAIAARLEQSVPAVRGVAWATYDQYLRSNRVAEGVASYDAVVDLILGVH